MTNTTDYTPKGFQSARQVLEGAKKDGEAEDAKGRKRKRNSSPSLSPPIGPLVPTRASTAVIDLTRSDDEPRPAGFPHIPPIPRPPIVRCPQPVYAQGGGWTTAATIMHGQLQKPSSSSSSSNGSVRHSPTANSSSTRNREYHNPPIIQQEHTLNGQQAGILARIMEGESFFFTGSAGTGKSVLLRAIIHAFKTREEELEKDSGLGSGWASHVAASKLGITASTGVSAINIGGSTLHSWAGIGIALEPIKELTEKVLGYQGAVDRWVQASALIIDEISMIDGTLFTKLDHIGKVVRKDDRPFGGLQLILCGDFFQLPPVSKEGDPPATYAFDSPAWSTAFSSKNMACLKEVFRQKDISFVRILNEMREGRISTLDLGTVQRLSRILSFPDSIPAVELYPTKNEVDRLNSTKLRAIQLPSYTVTPDQARSMLDRQTLFVPQIEIKIGAIVMLLKNHTDQGLCNGSVGKIVDFATLNEALDQGIGSVGMSSSDFAYTVFPIVEFIPGKYVTVATPKRVIVPCADIKIKNPGGSNKATRIQLPLILAWGLTVHKAQGLSLDRVKVDLARTFANGQAYVALSRATSMEGLQVLNFDATKIIVSKEVLEWSALLEKESNA